MCGNSGSIMLPTGKEGIGCTAFSVGDDVVDKAQNEIACAGDKIRINGK